MKKISRNSNEEIHEKIKSIPSLSNLLEKNLSGTYAVDNGGFMYKARFNKEEEKTKAGVSELERGSEFLETGEDAGREDSFHLGEKTSNAPSTVASKVGIEKKRRYAMSLATLASKPEKRAGIVQEGAIAILQTLSSSHDGAVQIRVASAFAFFSIDAQIRTRMLDEGALTSIVTLATNTNIGDAKSICLRAICNLCVEEGHEYKMMKEGVPFLITHIAQACPDTYDIGLKTLLNISCIKEKFHRIEDVTEVLIFFNNFQLTTEQEALLLSTFVNLSALRGNQLRLVEDGCMRVVEKHLKSPVDQLRLSACEILKNLTTDLRTRMKLLELNIISLLLDMSRDPMIKIRLQCMKAFLYLAKDSTFRQKMVDGESIELILKSCEDTSIIEMTQITTKTISILCHDPSIAPKLLRDGIGYALNNLLSCDDELVHQYCTESICSLLQLDKIVRKLIMQGADQTIVSLANRCQNLKTREWISFALYHLTKNSICSVQVNQETILPAVINMCSGSTDLTKSFCAASLAFLARVDGIDCSGAISLLVSMLRMESNQKIKKYCASALFSLANSNDNCYIMLDTEALIPVVELTQSEYIETKVLCAGIISRLSLHRQYYSQFAKGDVLKVLLELSCVDHRLTQRRVVVALVNLSQDDELRSILIDLNPIPYIVALASERDEYLRRGCISIVCNMSYLPGSEKAIVDAGIIPTLLITSLITSDQIVSKIICVKALINLMADKSLYKSMVKDGVIWGFSKLAQLNHDELLRLCAKGLCNLSLGYARDMLNSGVAVRCLTRLLQRPELDLKKAGAKIITNILMQTNDADQQFRKDSIVSISALIRIQDVEVMELCLICLGIISKSESCRPVIIRSEVFKLVDPSADIFKKPIVGYAYAVLFTNLAVGQSTRQKLIDNFTVERLEKIAELNDGKTNAAIINGLYCASCSHDAVVKLVDQGLIPFLQSMLDALNARMNDVSNNDSSLVKIKHLNEISAIESVTLLSATLYNLSTSVDAHNRLVSQGFVLVARCLWQHAVNDFDSCNMVFLSICNIACGKMNSSRMVSDGCSEILCFITSHKSDIKFMHYDFHYETFYYAAVALRNLLSITSNQITMVGAGCLETVISLAENAEHTKLNSRSDGSVVNASTSMHDHCAAALLSLTYNKQLRERIMNSAAISIILADIQRQGDSLPIDSKSLLKELETESWENGSRKRTKNDGKYKSHKPGDINATLLKGYSDVKLEVNVALEDLGKHNILLDLNEFSESKSETGAGGVQDGSGEELSISELTPQDGVNDDMNNTNPQSYPKILCEVNPEVTRVYQVDAANITTSSASISIASFGPEADTLVEEESLDGQSSAASLDIFGLKGNNGSLVELSEGSPSLYAPTKMSLPSLFSKASAMMQGEIDDTASDGSLPSIDYKFVQTQADNNKKMKAQRARVSKDARFEKLLSVIHDTKAGKEGSKNNIQEVTRLWRDMSSY